MKEYDLTKVVEFLEKVTQELKAISEPKRWRAEQGCRYFIMSAVFDIIPNRDERANYDNDMYNAGNYFQTEAECHEFCDKVKSLLR